MNERKIRTSLLSIALGCWQIGIALTFDHFSSSLVASDLITGFLLVLFGILCLQPQRTWEQWAIGLVGVWLQLAPLVFWSPSSLVYLNDTIVGALAIVFCFMFTKDEPFTAVADHPRGWSYNPSAWHHRLPVVGLAMLCWFFARYMAAYQLGYICYIWDPFFPDGTYDVITSDVSRAFPISDAGLGAFCYTLEAVFAWQGGTSRFATMPWLVCSFVFLVIPVGIVSIILIIMQPVIM